MSAVSSESQSLLLRTKPISVNKQLLGEFNDRIAYN